MKAELEHMEYRREFVRSLIDVKLPFQIRAMLRHRGWKVRDLSSRAEMTHGTIYNFLDPCTKVIPTIGNLIKIAAAFDCGLQIRLVPFSELEKWSNTESLNVPSYAEETQPTPEQVRECHPHADVGSTP